MYSVESENFVVILNSLLSHTYNIYINKIKIMTKLYKITLSIYIQTVSHVDEFITGTFYFNKIYCWRTSFISKQQNFNPMKFSDSTVHVL